MTKILVAEDDNLVAHVIEFKLKQNGYAVVVASQGEEALALAQAEKPSLIMLDWMMPIMDGLEVLRRLKENPDLKNIPVIILTSRSTESDIVEGLNLGATDYIVKPFKPAELLARIHKILGPASSGKDAAPAGG